MDLTDRVAVVTGSGRGIGRTIALRLAEAGANVVINDIGEGSVVESVADEVRAMNRESLAILGDVTSVIDVSNLVDTTVKTFGRLDILVNNAGITRDQLLLRMSEEDWDSVIAVNLKSVFLCTKAVIRQMTSQRWGRIINMSSVVGIAGNAGQANYAASKAGIIGFTKTVSKEVASRGITVNAIAPGWIESDLLLKTVKIDPERSRKVLSRTPMGRFGQAEDIGWAAVYLCSPVANFITGTCLPVDGGISIGF